ncbi:MAG: MBL fold metallo-hydrolase [Firmicutes bacterium]|nr:MBL fold metallo-hydrolase [Bacillota bacterium]
MNYIKLINGPIEENSFIVWDDKSHEGAIIDPGFTELDVYDKYILENNIKIKYIINTHGHWDHIKNNKLVKNAYGAKLLIHEDDNEYLSNAQLNLSYYYDKEVENTTADLLLKDKDEILLGNEVLKVMHTPGHTMGSIILYNDNLAFTGDTLFFGSVGRCDLPNSDKEIMIQTIEKFKYLLPKDSLVLPGHGKIESKFSEQLEINPFLTGKMKPK